MAVKKSEDTGDNTGGAAGGTKVPDAVRPAYEAIVALIDAFCGEHLNDEYAELSRKMAAKLARKRPSPLTKGKPASWACGIVRTVGFANFLDDPSQKPHMRLMDVSSAFGVSDSNAAAKSSVIRDVLKVHRFDPDWTVTVEPREEPDDLDLERQWPPHGHSPGAPRGPGRRLRDGADPVHPGGSG